ncbi:unnamed protein product [Phytophthora fragariaefolia]|uniref:Unnamed protein product n=1 Tax=Phytophthora fragariaefolia TaxID=1490495 RepID=A0A9W6XNS7_9STRA|nr:unnamed protein product [Phytophthora fragariaefolia]
MRPERGEEAAMLLSAFQQAAQRDAERLRQRRRAVRTLFGVVGAAALLVGCVAAVDVFALNGGNGGDVMTLEVTTGFDGDDDEAVAMEAQFGWNSIGYGWCSLKSSTWCMFSKDKDKCKEGVKCYKEREEPASDGDVDGDGDGSGSAEFGNATVGDASGEGDEEVGDVQSAVENPADSLDLGDNEDTEEEDNDDEAPDDDEDEDDEDEDSEDDEDGEDEDEAPADDEDGDEVTADDEDANDEAAAAGDV